MVKKIYLTVALSALSSVVLGSTQDQLTHIQSQIKSAVVAYQKAVMTIAMLTKKITPELATTVTSAIDQIIASQKFQEDLKTLTDSQSESIINGAFTKDMTYKPSIADYAAGKHSPLLIAFFNAMAKKAHQQLLWNKLRNKEKDLTAQLDATQPKI
jgi:hypothetical protein